MWLLKFGLKCLIVPAGMKLLLAFCIILLKCFTARSILLVWSDMLKYWSSDSILAVNASQFAFL